MAFLLAGLGVVMLMLPSVLVGSAERIGHKEWARIMGICLVGGLIALQTGLLLAAFPLLLMLSGASYHLSDPVVDHLAPGGRGVQLVALLVAVSVAVGFGRAALAMRNLRRRAAHAIGLGERVSVGEQDAVVVASAERMAFSLAGPSAVPVVTSGLVDALRDSELHAVLSHERVHMRHNHGRFLALAELVRASLPLGMGIRTAAAMQYVIERWADEESTGHAHGWRQTLRNALRSTIEGVPHYPAMHNRRVLALDATPVTTTYVGRTLVYLPVVALIGMSATLMNDGAGHVGFLAHVAFLH